MNRVFLPYGDTPRRPEIARSKKQKHPKLTCQNWRRVGRVTYLTHPSNQHCDQSRPAVTPRCTGNFARVTGRSIANANYCLRERQCIQQTHRSRSARVASFAGPRAPGCQWQTELNSTTCYIRPDERKQACPGWGCTVLFELPTRPARHRNARLFKDKQPATNLCDELLGSPSRGNRFAVETRPLRPNDTEIRCSYTRGISNPSRRSRATNDAAWSSPMICSDFGSHLMERPSRAAIALRWQTLMACT